MASFTLNKRERLKSKKLITELFETGQSTFSHPIKLIYLEFTHLDTPLKMSVSVPKRHFKSAVDRNLIKRRIREAYRQNKTSLENKLVESDKQIVMMLIFVAKEQLDYATIESAIKKLLVRL